MSQADHDLYDRDQLAADWAVRRREGLGAQEQARLDGWLAENAANRAAFERSEAVWDDWQGLDLRALAGSAQAAPPRAARRPLPAWAGIAASVAIAAVVAATAYASAGKVISTDRGEVRTVTLADGSQVTLGAGSRIAVRYDSHGRHLRLMRGEALFDVRHDASRPFDVRAEDTQVTVLGTQFTVKAAPDRVRVDVIQGIVRVAKAQGPIAAFASSPPQTARLVRGDRLESPRGGAMAGIESVDPGKIASWTKGRLIYADAPLGEVVSDLNRYAQVKVELADHGLYQLRVTAALRQDQAPGFLQSLSSTLPVTVENQNGVMVIRAAPQAGG